MDIHDLKPEDVIIKDHLEYYEKGMDFFYQELISLNVNLFILEKIFDFPFYLFTNYGESIFFRIVLQNFFHSSLLIITRITTDQGTGTFTLPRFKNNIRQHSKSKYKNDVDNALRQVKFDKKTRDMLGKAKKIRTQKVAHVLEEIVFGEKPEEKVYFNELQSIRDQLNLLLDTLSINTEHMMLPIPYSPDVTHPKDRDNRTDIEKILDSIALSSTILNMPEKEPRAWSYKLKTITENELNLINNYRSKFGLSEINKPNYQH